MPYSNKPQARVTQKRSGEMNSIRHTYTNTQELNHEIRHTQTITGPWPRVTQEHRSMSHKNLLNRLGISAKYLQSPCNLTLIFFHLISLLTIHDS